MEFSIKMLVVVFLVLVMAAVILTLITNWGGQSGAAVEGLFKFFNNLLAGKSVPSTPNLPT